MGSIFSAGHILAFFSWALALAWLGLGIAAHRGFPRLTDLTRIDPDSLPSISPSDAPDLTVIVPARDEERSIEASLRSLLSSTGIRLQIIAVDDRSADSTGERMDAIAAESRAGKSTHQLDVVHITELPAGWLGKPHAMEVAAQLATAPWILFTDGDVVFTPRALELALRQAAALHADHLVLLPTVILKSAGERAVLAAMQALAIPAVRLWKVSDPRARDYMGAGGFNMIRREAYAQIGGFATLRMEIIEDVHLGRLVKRAGFKQVVVLGPGLVSVRWIQGTFGVFHLLEKNGFAVTRFRTPLHLLACLGFAIDALLPLVAIAHGGITAVAGIVFYLAIFLIYHASRRVAQVPARYALLFAPAVLIVLWAFFRSMIVTLARNGVIWRGTLYSLSELRRAARES
jgi:glycosyltransferase involved in cell wall biosynthesis